MSQPTASEPTRATLYDYRLVIVSLAATLATFSVASFYPGRQSADEAMSLSFASVYGWILAQSYFLTLPGLLVGFLLTKLLPRIGGIIGAALIYAVPVIVVCDVLTFAWIGERFLSGTMHRIATTLAPALAMYITRSVVIDTIAAISFGVFAMMFSWWLAGRVANRIANSPNPVSPMATIMVLTMVAALMSIPATWNLSRTLAEMRDQSVRHPVCAFHFVGYRGVGVHVPQGEKATLARLRGLQSAKLVQPIDQRQLAIQLDKRAFEESNQDRPRHNVIIIVAESIRPEIIDPEVMPNLYAFAQRSIYCKQHFSAGNSTIFGMFSLFNGLESIWFDRPICDHPILNRVFREAGYELAFHAGEEQWESFGMAGYVSADHFDHFEVEYPDPLATEYRAVQRSVDFIDEGHRVETDGDKWAAGTPRLVMTYLLNTHSRYLSEEEDQIFQPAAPESFSFPYSHSIRDAVYNRYKNSARTLDRIIKPLLRDDCVVIFMGDHGESFLEDGSAIHGLRLSRVQNMTPLVLHYPGVEPRIIEQRTSHIDILPTLFSLLQFPIKDGELLEGVDLTTADPRALEDRIFATANMIDRSTGLIGPWTSDPNQPFAYRFVYNIGQWQINYLNPIDDQGYECPDPNPNNPVGERLFRQWVERRIGAVAVDVQRSEQELFTEFFGSDDPEIRKSAIRIANDIAVPEPYLYDLIAEATHDSDPEIREMAKEIVIRTERYVSRSE